MDDTSRHSPNEAAAGSVASQARSASAAACLVCRSRKVRCGRELPGCRNCVRMGIRCPGYNVAQGVHGTRTRTRREVQQSAEDIYRAAGVEKRRVGSCRECHATKSRCSMTRPSCERCLSKSLACVYVGRRQRDRGPNREDQAGNSQSPLGSHSVSSAEIAGQMVMIAGSPSRPLASHTGTTGLEYMYEDDLPDDPAVRLHLINTFFQQVQPLRSVAFIHKPSFMAALRRNTVNEEYGEPLLYAMCALAARVLFINAHIAEGPSHTARMYTQLPGGAWSEKARRQVLPEAHMPTIQHIMTMVLLCEYGLRTHQNALAFFLSGCLFRAIRVLGLDAPRSPRPSQPSVTDQADTLNREVEHRLVWASYFIDTMTASGVDKNSSWGVDFPHVPLPCSDQQFLSRSGTTNPIFLSDLAEWQTDRPPSQDPSRPSLSMADVMRDMDLPALTSILVQIRASVLRLIRTPPSMLPVPVWDESSEFMRIIRKLDAFHDNIPDRFRLTELNFYVHQDQHIVGAVYSLFFLYHSAVFDLTRVTLAGFSFPLSTAFQSQIHGTPPEFRQQCQERCRYHADQVSRLVIQAIDSSVLVSLDESFCSAVAFESAKIQIVYAATVVHDTATTDTTRNNVHANLRLLTLLHAGKGTANGGESNLYVRTLLPLCMRFGLQDLAHAWGVPHRQSTSSQMDDLPSEADIEITGSSAIHHLSGAAPFRQARTELRARQQQMSPASVSDLPPAGPTLQPQPQIHAASSGSGSTSTDFTISPSYPGTAVGSVPVADSIASVGAVNTVTSVSAVDTDLMLSMDASMAEYAKAAHEMQYLLTWDVSEPTSMPPWLSFDYDWGDTQS